MHKTPWVMTVSLVFLMAIPVSAFDDGYTMAPDGSYVGGTTYTMAPDGSYVGGMTYTMAPDGSYVGGTTYTMAPDGSYVGGTTYTMAPDGSYVGRPACTMTPEGRSVGRDGEGDSEMPTTRTHATHRFGNTRAICHDSPPRSTRDAGSRGHHPRDH